jgi:hypothetical protein
MNSKDLKGFSEISEMYGELIWYIVKLRKGPIHSNVKDNVEDFLSKGYDKRKAIRTALNKNRPFLEEIWDDEMETDNEDSEMEEEDGYES